MPQVPVAQTSDPPQLSSNSVGARTSEMVSLTFSFSMKQTMNNQRVETEIAAVTETPAGIDDVVAVRENP